MLNLKAHIALFLLVHLPFKEFRLELHIFRNET